MRKPAFVLLALLFTSILLMNCSRNEKEKIKKTESSSVISQTPKIETSQEKEIPDSAYKYYNNNKYIVFIKNDLFISLYDYIGKTNYSDYTKMNTIIGNTQEDPIWFLDLKNDLLVLDEGTSPNPHVIIVYDIVTKKNILDGYFYKNIYEIKNNKITILKEIGNTITQNEVKMVPKETQIKIERFIAEDPKNADALMYYYEYTFDFNTRKIDSSNTIFAISVL